MTGYDQAFYDAIRPGVIGSAQVVAPLVKFHINPRTVLDVGCGEGWWAHTFAQLGCEVIGIDGLHVPASPLGDRFMAHDLIEPFADRVGRFDLAVCLEVAEHLPESRSISLIEDLTTVADVVLFSAAIPGQGGVHHVNEQWPAYWEARFRACGFTVSGALRWKIWDDHKVENWYRQNLMIATRTPEAYPDLFDTPLAPTFHVVHPVLWLHRTGT